MAVRLRALSWDDDNESHISKHGVTPREVSQMVENRHIVVRNRRERRAPLQLIGRTHGGRVLCVPIEPTSDADVWRPVTAFPATAAQTALLERNP